VPAGIHPSSGEPLILACGCVPVQTESEEQEVRSSLSGVVIAGTLLALLNVVIATTEGILGAEADTARRIARETGLAARLEAQGLGTSSGGSAIAAVLGAFGADSWQLAVTMAAVTGAMAVFAVPLTVTALVRKSRRLTRMAQTFAALTTALTLLVILGLGAAGHLATRDNAALSALYVAQGVLVSMSLGSVALRLEGLAGEPTFWLFAKTHAIDLNTEVMLELERRRDEEEDRIRRALAGEGSGEDDDEDGGSGRDGDGEEGAMVAFVSSPSRQRGDGAAAGGAGAARLLLGALGGRGQGAGAAGDAGKQGEARDAAPTGWGSTTEPAPGAAAAAAAAGQPHGAEAYPQAAGGYGQAASFAPAPAAAPLGPHWLPDGSYVDEYGGVQDAYGGYTWPDGAGYTDASQYFYASDGFGGFAPSPSEPPAWSQAAQSYQGAGPEQRAAAPAAAPAAAVDPSAARAQAGLAAFGFEQGQQAAGPGERPGPAGRAIVRADSDDEDVGALVASASALSSGSRDGTVRSSLGPVTSSGVSRADAAPPAPSLMQGVTGPQDRLVMPASAAGPAAGAGSKHRPAPSTTSAVNRIRKMAPTRVTLPTTGGSSAPGAAATAAAKPPARFPLF